MEAASNLARIHQRAAQHKENPKETKELPKEIIEAINNRDLTEVQRNLLFLIITIPSITLVKMAEELDLTIDQVRSLRKKMENISGGIFSVAYFRII